MAIELKMKDRPEIYDIRLDDMWSLGVILLLMLTNSYAFVPNNRKFLGSDHLMKAYERMRYNRYCIPKDCVITCEARSVVCQLLEFDWSRMDCTQILLNEWFGVDLNYTTRRPLPPIHTNSLNS